MQLGRLGNAQLKGALAAFILAAIGCATELSEEGSAVRIVQGQGTENCSFVTTLSASNEMGLNMEQNTDGAMNKARNKAASAGANAIRIINVETEDGVTTVAAEALNCQ